ncbi:hypothetical protein SOVF_214230, partial [Spinacia oleracea]
MDEEQSQNQPSECIDLDQDEEFVDLVDDDDLTQTPSIPSTVQKTSKKPTSEAWEFFEK